MAGRQRVVVFLLDLLLLSPLRLGLLSLNLPHHLQLQVLAEEPRLAEYDQKLLLSIVRKLEGAVRRVCVVSMMSPDSTTPGLCVVYWQARAKVACQRP